MPRALMEEQRREVFRTLVQLQDQGWSTQESRRQIADQFSIAVADLDDVEREGITKQWPPL